MTRLALTAIAVAYGGFIFCTSSAKQHDAAGNAQTQEPRPSSLRGLS